MQHNTIVYVHVIFCTIAVNVPDIAKALSVEAKLMRRMTNTLIYDKHARPVQNVSSFVEMNVTFYVTQIGKVEDKEETIEIFGYLDVYWIDTHLKWNPAEHEGVKKIVLPSEKAWVPDIGLFNSLEADIDFSQNLKYKLTVESDGTVGYFPGGNYKVGCSLDMSFFPFDTQTCSFEFGSWSLDGDLVRLNAASKRIDLNEFVNNSQWDLVSTSMEGGLYNITEDPPTLWSRVVATMTIRRKSGYYVMNILFPCMAISALILLVFYIPSESGEKVSLGITILLSFSVFQVVVAEFMPKSSETPIFVNYLTILMAMSAISTIFSVMVLNLHHKGGTRNMPKFLRFIIFNCLACLVCMSDVAKKHRISNDSVAPMNNIVQEEPKTKGDITEETRRISQGENLKPAENDQMLILCSGMLQILDALRKKESEKENRARTNEVRLKWVHAGRVLDRFLMALFFVINFLVTFICLFIMPKTQNV